MRRFLILYRDWNDERCYAEGLVHFNGAVYAAGFCHDDKLYLTLNDLENALRENENIKAFNIHFIDPERG